MHNLKPIFDTFEAHKKQLFLVGGAVRDHLRGVPEERLTDLDFATDASPDESLTILQKAGFATHEVGKRFGTIGTLLRGPKRLGYPKDCQVTTFRSREHYSKGSRHPQVEFGQTIEDDLWRRDFSINSIAMRADGTLVDPYSGAEDIERRVLRSVGDPQLTLRDDPLRMLRIARFMSSLGYLPVEELQRAAFERAEAILEISHERWLIEMDKLLVGAHSTEALQFLLQSRLLGLILPEVAALSGFHRSATVHHKDLWAHTLAVVKAVPPSSDLRWAALLHDIGKIWTRRIEGESEVFFWRHELHGAMLFEGIAQRFRFSRSQRETVGHLILHHGRIAAYTTDWSDSAVRRLVSVLTPYTDELLAISRADLTTANEERRAEILTTIDHLAGRLSEMRASDALAPTLPSRLGSHLMTHFGLTPGPALGEKIARLRDAIIEGKLPVAPSLEDCYSYLSSLDTPAGQARQDE